MLEHPIFNSVKGMTLGPYLKGGVADHTSTPTKVLIRVLIKPYMQVYVLKKHSSIGLYQLSQHTVKNRVLQYPLLGC